VFHRQMTEPAELVHWATGTRPVEWLDELLTFFR
jgi:hypothetical protein